MRLSLFMAVLALSACGAGSSGGGGSVAGATASRTDEPAAKATADRTQPTLAERAALRAGDDSGLSGAITGPERTEFGLLLNDLRGQRATVMAHDILNGVAQDYTAEIVGSGRSIRAGDNLHIGLDGSTVGDRAIAAGYDYRWIGENIAEGFTDSQDVLDAWMSSNTGHREVLLAPEAEDFGLGRTDETWVLIMGAER